jgi:hypothetical protein
MTDAQKLSKIRAICRHPSSQESTGVAMVTAIMDVLNDDTPIDYLLSDQDEPIHYELAHDAVFVDEEVQ